LSEIRELIKNFVKEKTIILSTHIMQEVQAICDRVLIIHRGKLVADDTLDQLEARMEGEAVVEVAFKNAIEVHKLEQVDGVKRVVKNDDGSFRLIADQGADVREQLFRLAVEMDNPVMELSKSRRNLEDVFRQLTK
jgi:ABC-2 type transport system ATP-binding protein